MEEALKTRAKKLIKSGKMKKANIGSYVYGTMRKTGWTPSTQKS